MNEKLIDQVRLPLDDRYTIVVSKDHVRGIVIQLARMNPTHVKTDKGATYKGHEPVVLASEAVNYGKQALGIVSFKTPEELSAELEEKVSKLRALGIQFMKTESVIDDLMSKLEASK